MPFKNKQEIFSYDKDIILAHIVRRERENENNSINFLAESLEISPSYLSAIELGKKKPSSEVLKKIEDQLFIKFYLDETTEEEVQLYLHKISEYYIFGNYNKIKDTYLKIEKVGEEKYYFSYGVCDYLLIKIIYLIVSNKNSECTSLFKEIKTLKKILSAENSQLCAALESSYLMSKRDYHEALKILREAKLTMHDNEQIAGIYYAKYALALNGCGYYHEALIASENAQKSFSKCFNMIQIIESSIIQANIYSTFEPRKALMIYKRLLVSKDYIKNEIERYSYAIYCNISWVCFLMDDYEKVVLYTKLALEIGKPENSLYYQLPFSYWKLGDNQKALMEIENIQPENGSLEYELLEIIKLNIESAKDIVPRIKLCLDKIHHRKNMLNENKLALKVCFDMLISNKEFELACIVFQEI